MKKTFMSPSAYALYGLITGAVCRMMDIYTENIGNIFSQMPVWILLCTVISVFSRTALYAALNNFLFCGGMLITYYTAAWLTDGVFSGVIITGWIIFLFAVPLLSYITWHVKDGNLMASVTGAGIIAVSFLSSVILYDGPGIWDLVINLILCYIIFIKKIRRL